MCGIITHIAFDDTARLSADELHQLNELQRHRGPDSGGVYCDGNAGLGVRRLAVIDLQTGDQPISSHDGRYVIVFNGEIYNHAAIHRALVQKGYPLKTQSDTETLLYAFIDRGPACLSELNGMFAFAIWDKKDQELFLARDRMGIKPLYYTMDGSRALFSSELTPIYASGLFSLTINHRAVMDYLAYWYICEPATIFNNVYQVPPGHYAFIKKGQLNISSYWELPCGAEQPLCFTDATQQLEELLRDSIKLRMKVDVPIGTFLSGGIDSGLVTAFSVGQTGEPLKAFAIGFKETSYSELKEALKTAKRYHVDFVYEEIERIDPTVVEEVIQAFDEPLGNASFVPTYFLAKMAAQHVKVVLTGDGGDELFGGYPTYQAPYYQNIYRRIPPSIITLIKKAVKKLPVSHDRISLDYRLKRLMEGLDFPYTRAHFTWREVTPRDVQAQLFHPDIWRDLEPYDSFSVADRYFQRADQLSVKNQLMYVDLNTYLLNDHLRKVDRMTMAHSLEARLPYLDYRIVSLAMQMPSEHKITFGTTKKILRHLAKPYLPPSVIHGPKKGLTSPIAGWITGELREYIKDRLKGGLLADLFETKTVEAILAEHYAKKKDNSRIIWSLLTLQGWGDKVKKFQKSPLVGKTQP